MRIAFLNHPPFPKCSNAMWQSHLAARFITARNKKCSVWPGHGRKFTKNPLCVPLCPLCLCVKKVFLQSKKSSVLLRNKNPMCNAIANRLPHSSSFAKMRCGNLILPPGFINEIKSVSCGPTTEEFTKNPLRVPLCFLCLRVKKVFLQSKNAVSSLETETPSVTSLRITSQNHSLLSHFISLFFICRCE